FFFFFFSSRRRHTRFSRDWSSDVCSSDLIYTDVGLMTTNETYAHDVSEFFNVITGHSYPQIYKYLITAPRDMRQQLIDMIRNERSEERRVGKECRSRWTQERSKKKTGRKE